MTTQRTTNAKDSSQIEPPPDHDLTQEQEDAALVRAIDEGLSTGRVTEREVFDILEGRDGTRISE